ncbi:MAG: YtxH domain-containing protein [Anaerolineae bacterium]|nr:YtxH domain-containing protein [Anaerolineae bacterium]
MRKVFSFLAGLLIGVITGGALGLLFAPESGAAVKQKIQEYMDRLIDEGKAAAEIRRQELEAQLEAFKQGQPIRLTPAKEE